MRTTLEGLCEPLLLLAFSSFDALNEASRERERDASSES